MSKKSDYKPERNPLLVVLYIVAVVILLGCIVFFVFVSRERQKTYKEQTRQASENETEYIMTERVRETESETEASKPESSQNSGSKSGSNTANTPKTSVSRDSDRQSEEEESETEGKTKQKLASDMESEMSESDSEEESETSSEEEYKISTAEKAQTILVLNGTRKPGVAGAWKAQLQKLGYRHVVSASYTGEIEDNTVIYAQHSVSTEGLQHQFPNSETKVGGIEDGIEPGEGERLPEEIDAYIVVGRNDVTVESSVESE